MLSSDPNVFQSFNLHDEKQSLAYALEKDEISEMRFCISIFKKTSLHICIPQCDISGAPYVLEHLVAIKYQNYKQTPV